MQFQSYNISYCSLLLFIIVFSTFNFIPVFQKGFVLTPRGILHLLLLLSDHNCLLNEIVFILITLAVDQSAIYIMVILHLVSGSKLCQASEKDFPSVLVVAIVRRKVLVKVVESN